MEIYLNGNRYQLVAGTGVRREPLAEWPDNIRLDGQQKRKDRRWVSSWAIDIWDKGLMVEQENVDVATLSGRIWDADNCDTRNSQAIILSPAFNTCTITPSMGDIDKQLQHLTDLYFCHSGAERSIAYLFTPPFTLGSYKYVIGTLGDNLKAVKAVGAQVVVLADAAAQTEVLNAVGLGDYTYKTGVRVGTSAEYADIVDCGGTLHLLAYASNTAEFFLGYIPTSGGTINAEKVDSFNTTVGSYLAPLLSDGLTVYAQLPEGIYDFDETPGVIIDTRRAIEMNCKQTMFQNYLHFKNHKSLIKYDGTDLESVGFDKLDGLPDDKWGEITAMCSSWKYNFAAVKGPSYSHILCSDGQYWHYYAKIPSMGLWVKDMFLSNSPDAIDRLWCVFGNHPYPGYFLNPMVNPLQAATYSWVPTGYFTKPIFDGGMAEENGAFYDQLVTADAIGSNTITSFYGLNGASPVTTLGIVASTTQQLIFGSPYGLEAYRIQPKFMLYSSATGTTPVFRNAINHYLKIPKEREQFSFTVDLKSTAQRETRPLEAVIGSLNYERGLRTLQPFWYGKVGTKAVKVLQNPSDEETEERMFEGEREGIMSLAVAEIF